jgi:hypothetical protein
MPDAYATPQHVTLDDYLGPQIDAGPPRLFSPLPQVSPPCTRHRHCGVCRLCLSPLTALYSGANVANRND